MSKTDVTYIFNVKSDTLTENEATTLVNMTLSAIPDVQIAGLLRITEMEDRKAIVDALKYRRHPEENPLVKQIESLTATLQQIQEGWTMNELQMQELAKEELDKWKNPPSN